VEEDGPREGGKAMMRDLRILARRERGKEPVVSIMVALGLGGGGDGDGGEFGIEVGDVDGRCERRMEARMLSDICFNH